jgi:hypothetical protein
MLVRAALGRRVADIEPRASAGGAAELGFEIA